MKPFNLAESRIVERTYCQRHINQRIRITAVFLVLVLLTAVGCWACRVVITNSTQHAKSELANVENRSADVKRDISGVKSQIGQRKWQEQLAKASERWLEVLDSALACLPADAWLTRIETSPKDSCLAIEGRAASFDSLSQFTTALRENHMFAEVRLGSTKITRSSRGSFIEFTLPVRLKAGEGGAPGAPAAQAAAPTTAGNDQSAQPARNP